MKVLLISANTETINMRTIPWGLGCVAAAARNAGHDVLLLDLMVEPDTHAAISRAVSGHKPEVIGISVRNIDDQSRGAPTFFLKKVKDVVEGCRKLSNATVVLGGAGYSIFPQTALEYLGADMGIQGEGETAFPALLKRLEKGELGGNLQGIPGLYLPQRGLQGERVFSGNLDSLPLPDDSLLEASDPAEEGLWIPVQTRRGCYLNCSYCSTATIEGHEVRKRSPEPVVEWISRQADAGFLRFFFVDNNFNIPPGYPVEICRQITDKELDITWRCILNPLHVDEELLKIMFDAGCREVSLGFESGNERILRQMNKSFNLEEIRRSGELLAGQGIRRMGFLLLGGPGETRESVEESLAFADSLDFEAMRITAGIRIYPQTRLARTAIDEGIIAPTDDLLVPRFYLAGELEGWIDGTLRRWKSRKPNWIF